MSSRNAHGQRAGVPAKKQRPVSARHRKGRERKMEGTRKTTRRALWAGAALAFGAAVAVAVTGPFSTPVSADEGTVAGASAAADQPAVDAAAIIEAAGIIPSEEWADTYPNEYASFMENADNEELVDYLEEYPYLNTLYAGNAFSKDYKGARGHAYTLQDVSETLRAPAMANCLSCKTPQMNALISSGEEGVYSLPFDDVLELCEEPVGCYTCHENTGDELVVTNTFLTDALGEDASDVAPANQVCGQCHNEYYFDPQTKATTLPYTSLETMTPDAILAYYNEIGFSDYTDPQTGVEFVKVQHPEFETVMGEGFKMVGYDCADCHMGTAMAQDGTEYADHNLTSPLENAELIETNCSNCHEDLVAEVEAIQEQAESRTNEIGTKLETLTNELAAALEAGTVSDEDFQTIAELNRTAMFYWDFVFVENSEGAHNSTLTNDCLDKAEAAVDEALAMLA